jgi:flagellar motor switch protein FliG
VSVHIAPRELPGVRKAAILAVLLGTDCTGQVFKFLREEEVERIAREVAALGPIGADTGAIVLEEFHALWHDGHPATRGGVDAAEALLETSLPPEPARRVRERVVETAQSSLAFAGLESADPQQLSKFVLNEHPQTIALILAHLRPSQAAQLLNALPDDRRVEVVTRMASLDEIAPDVMARIAAVIEQRLEALGGGSHEAYGGVRAVAELLNQMDRSVGQGVLEAIDAQSPDLAVSIRNLMFVFDDLERVEDTALREIVQRVDKRVLTVALKGASDAIRRRFFQNMSRRATEMVREEMEVIGAVRLRDVEKAQQDVVAIARKLEEEGLLATGAAAGEPYVL